jgi:hypothetical protein
MDDLIPFVIFIIIAIVNLLKYLTKKGRGDKSKPAPSEQGAPKQQPSTIEAFFESLASKLEPPATEVADWPEGSERPDYMKEMETFEDPVSMRFDAEETAEVIPMLSPEAAPRPVPAAWKTSEKPAEIERMAHVASLKSAMRSMPALLSNSKNMRFSSPPILRSSDAGRNDLPLKERATLRQAMLANLVFSPPRAFEVEFDNVIIQ